MSLECPHCQSTIPPSAIDEARQIATCSPCGRIIDLQSQPADAPQRPRMRAAVGLPAGMAMRSWWNGPAGSGTPDGLEITRRWLRSKHFGFLGLAGCMIAGVAYMWEASVEPPQLVILATIATTVFALRMIPMFVNSTTIRVTGDRVEVRHGPFPSIIFRNQTVAGSDLKQLFAVKFGPNFEVGAELNDGSKLTLVRPLVSEEQALFVEQRLEKHLGIVDFAVEGELALPEGKPAAVSTGAGGAIAVLPLLFLLGIVVFFVSLSSSVEGSFALGKDGSTTTFIPDACVSGEPQGYFGVELRSEASPGVSLRVIKDPIGGSLLILQRGNEKPTKLAPKQCTSMQLGVNRSDTRINHVWAVNGDLHVDCPGIKGSAKFEGCH